MFLEKLTIKLAIYYGGKNNFNKRRIIVPELVNEIYLQNNIRQYCDYSVNYK